MTENPDGPQRTTQLLVYGFRNPKYRPRPWLNLRVVLATTSLSDARKILGREGFDRPKRHFRVDDKEAESLALANPGTLVWQSFDDWESGTRSWRIGGTHVIEEAAQSELQRRGESGIEDQR
jgi:hypothetical protein